MTAEVKTTTGKAAHYTAGFFITRVVQLLPDGRQLLLHSRWHRKGLPPVQVGSDGTALRVAPVAKPWLQLWAPHRIAWWIALLFIIGSACFALGSFASNWPHYCPLWLTNSPIINTLINNTFFTSPPCSITILSLLLLFNLLLEIFHRGFQRLLGHNRAMDFYRR